MLLDDDLSCFIISEIYLSAIENKEITSWIISKNYLNRILKSGIISEQEKSNRINIEHMRINHRIKLMEKEGLIVIKRNSNSKVFEIISDRVLVGKKSFPNGIKNAIMIKKKSTESWAILEYSPD